MKALAQQKTVGVGVAHDDANLVRGEARERAALGQKIFALAQQQAVHQREAFDDFFAVVRRVDRLRAEPRAVLAVGEF